MITCIWAEDRNGAIGLGGKLPWKLPNDMKFFKGQTIGKTVIMGRKTFEGMGSRPLPNRKNIVLTRQMDYQADGVEVIHHPHEITKKEDVMVIGGSEVYQLFLPIADQLIRTKIDATFEADAYFPKIDWSEWTLVSELIGSQSAKDQYPHRFEFYRRKKDESL